MKTLVIFLSLISTPLFSAYSRYDFYDNVELFLEDCRIENEEQYARLDAVLRAFEALDKREQDIIYCYTRMVIKNAKYLEEHSCCSDGDLDDMIEEVFSSCESCC